MNSEASITIILPTYNRRKFLPKALRDLKAQTFADWRCVIVNDGGESVADIVAAAEDPRFELFERPHQGKPAQLNWALSQVRSEWVSYADDDDELYPDHLETLYNAAKTSGRKVVFTRFKTTWLDSAGNVKAVTPASTVPITSSELRSCLNGCGASQVTFMHSLDLARQVGGYNESMKILIDYDFIRRVALKSDPFYVDHVTLNHIMRGADPIYGKLNSISGLWQRDPEAAGRSLLMFFSSDPAALTQLYLDAGRGLSAIRRLEKLRTSLPWRLLRPFAQLFKKLTGRG